MDFWSSPSDTWPPLPKAGRSFSLTWRRTFWERRPGRLSAQLLRRGLTRAIRRLDLSREAFAFCQLAEERADCSRRAWREGMHPRAAAWFARDARAAVTGCLRTGSTGSARSRQAELLEALGPSLCPTRAREETRMAFLGALDGSDAAARKALATVEQLRRQEPQDPELRHLLAFCLLTLGELDGPATTRWECLTRARDLWNGLLREGLWRPGLCSRFRDEAAHRAERLDLTGPGDTAPDGTCLYHIPYDILA